MDILHIKVLPTEILKNAQKEKVHGSSDLNETVVSDLGQLVCDLPHQNVSTLTEAGFSNALPYLTQCINKLV